MMFIDTHAHIDDKSFNEEKPEEIIARAKDADVGIIITPGIDYGSSLNLKGFADLYPEVYFAVGLHAHDAKNFTEKDFISMKKLLAHEKALAVGEVGLDYHYEFTARSLQKHVLKRFLDLAAKISKPLILHCREAEEDLYEMLSQYGGGLRGVIHCYTGNREWAKKFLDLGFYIGFTGIVTFKNSDEIRKVVEETQDDRILSETDSPYMTPAPHRGKRNEPAHLPLIVEAIAKIKGKSVEKMSQLLLSNAEKCFGVEFVNKARQSTLGKMCH